MSPPPDEFEGEKRDVRRNVPASYGSTQHGFPIDGWLLPIVEADGSSVEQAPSRNSDTDYVKYLTR
jgi:hypothetical protein